MRSSTSPADEPVFLHARTRTREAALDLRGDEGELFAHHHVQLERAVSRIVPVRRCVIEDACAFAWLHLCVKQPDRRRAYPWLVVVARNQAIHLSRTDARKTPLTGDPSRREDGEVSNVVELVADPIDDEERRELAGRAHEALLALATLPERQRLVLQRKVAGLSYREIAAELGWSYTQVNRHLVRARQGVREVA